MKADFRIATPSEKESLWGKNPEYREEKYILVSGDNSTVSKANRLLPSHFLLSDGTMMKRLSKPRVIDYRKYALKTHAQMYADMFLYVAESLVRRVKQMVEVCQAEALFRIDPNLSMSNTNVAVTWINTSFPRERGAVYARVEEDGEELPDRVGEFVRMSRIEDRYQRK